MPAEIFAIKNGVVYRYILRLPESVFGYDASVANYGVADILEHILRVAIQPIDIYVLAEHKGISAVMEFQVADTQSLNTPERLVGIGYGDVLHAETVHLAEELRPVYRAVAHLHVVTIPDGRARAHLEIAVRNETAINVPQRILSDEAAAVGLDILAALHAALSFGYCHVLKARVLDAKQRTFAAEALILN